MHDGNGSALRLAAAWLEEPGAGPPHYGHPLDLDCPNCGRDISFYATVAACRALREQASRSTPETEDGEDDDA